MFRNNKSTLLLQFIVWFRSYFCPYVHLLGIPFSCLLYRIRSESLNSDFARAKACFYIAITVSQVDATFSLVCEKARFISGKSSDSVLLTFSLN